MSELGFYIDIQGIKKILESDEDKAWYLIISLANDLHILGEAISNRADNIGRFFAYQMGDGFMVHFDNVLNEYGPCRGNAKDIVLLSTILLQRFLIEHKGILRAGIGTGKLSGTSGISFRFANQLNGYDYRCGAGKFFILPIMGTLLANTYPLTTKSAKHSGPNRHEPRLWIASNVLDSLSEIKNDLIEISFGDKSKAIWSYVNILNPTSEIKELYFKIWKKKINRGFLEEALAEYNRMYPMSE